MYSTKVESLRRLYLKKFITLAYLDEQLLLEKITQEEYDYIIS